MHVTAHILDEPAVRDAALPITVAQYHRLSADGVVPERTELLQGIIVEQMTKSPLHTFLVRRLAAWLAEAVPPAWHVRKEEPLTLADSEPEPDLAVVTGSADDYRERHPGSARLVIEVAISTLGIDRAKAPVYAAAGVHEYWIVIPETRSVEIHREPSADGYRIQLVRSSSGDVLELALPLATPLPLGRLFG
ncbi:MAG: Uma2 family endonuclease [Planctomycetia bacterium]